MLSVKLWRWSRRIGPWAWERFLVWIICITGLTHKCHPHSAADQGAGPGSRFLETLGSGSRDQWTLGRQSGENASRRHPGNVAIRAQSAQSEVMRRAAQWPEVCNAPRRRWCDVSWRRFWQMPAEHDAVTLIMGYFLACWANLIIIPPGHGIKRREKHPFISSFPIPGAETNTLGEMILQTKYFSLSLVQCLSSSLNWSHRTHFLWTRAEVYTNQSIRSNEISPSLSWYWSLFSLLIISVM